MVKPSDGTNPRFSDHPAELALPFKPPVPATPVWAIIVLAVVALGLTQASTENGPAGNVTRGSVNGTARKLPFVVSSVTAVSPSPELIPVAPLITLVLE